MTDVAAGPTGGTRLAIEYKKEKETSLADSYGNPSSIASALSAHPRVLSGEGSTIQSPPPLFFFPQWEISPRTPVPLLRPGSVFSGSAS